jgi:hypothetical protein
MEIIGMLEQLVGLIMDVVVREDGKFNTSFAGT